MWFAGPAPRTGVYREGALRCGLKLSPGLRVGLLEGGADWGSHVYTHLVDRWEKRNRHAVQNYNPAHADLDLLVIALLHLASASHHCGNDSRSCDPPACVWRLRLLEYRHRYNLIFIIPVRN